MGITVKMRGGEGRTPAAPTPRGVRPPAPGAPIFLMGGWGDVLAGFGNLVSQAPPGSGPYVILYYGYEPAVVPFLLAQPLVGEVHHVTPESREQYLRVGADPKALADRHGAVSMCPPFCREHTDEPRRWHGAFLPEASRQWTEATLPAREPGRKRFILFPRSTDNNSWAGHWGGWPGLIEWLLAHTEHEYVLCGQDGKYVGSHPRLHNWLNRTSTLMEVFAAADLCDGVLTTSTGLSLYSVVQGIPQVVLCNDRDRPGGYFYEWVHHGESVALPQDTGFDRALSAVKELLERAEWEARQVKEPEPEVLPDGVLVPIRNDGAIRLCVPPGLGDISWLYSAGLHCLAEQTGREVILYLADDRRANAPGDWNQIATRSDPFIRLLPNVRFGGYVPGRCGWEVVHQSLPAEWPEHMGLGPIVYSDDRVTNVSANLHLEMGHSLEQLWPLLPTDYHYPLAFSAETLAAAEARLEGLPRAVCAIYVSNRDKEQYDDWRLWTADDWLELMEATGAKSFVVLGATWDADKTEEVATRAAERWPVVRLIGEPLDLVLAILERCDLGCFYPSGMGIIANVLRLPAAMLLPSHLKNLKRFSDPADRKARRFKVFPSPGVGQKPAVAEVAAFLRPHAQVERDEA